MNPEKKTCSICIANFNGEKLLPVCLQSIREQHTSIDIEVIVHDDASTDRSLEVLKDYPEAKIIRSRKNLGFCQSNNKMASLATGDFLLFLNNDARLVKDSVDTLYEKSRERHHGAIIGLPQYDSVTGRLLDLGYRLDIFLNPIWNKEKAPICYVSGACMWIPRKLWQDTGGFPDFFGSVGEDLYLCLIARLLGYPVDMAYDSRFFHFVGQSLGGGNPDGSDRLSSTYKRRFLSERNRLFVMWLTYPLPALAIIAPCHLFITLAEGIALSLLTHSIKPLIRIYLRAVQHFFSSLRLLKKRRDRIQINKRIGTKAFFRDFMPFPYRIVLFLKYGIPRLTVS